MQEEVGTLNQRASFIMVTVALRWNNIALVIEVLTDRAFISGGVHKCAEEREAIGLMGANLDP